VARAEAPRETVWHRPGFRRAVADGIGGWRAASTRTRTALCWRSRARPGH